MIPPPVSMWRLSAPRPGTTPVDRAPCATREDKPRRYPAPWGRNSGPRPVFFHGCSSRADAHQLAETSTLPGLPGGAGVCRGGRWGCGLEPARRGAPHDRRRPCEPCRAPVAPTPPEHSVRAHRRPVDEPAAVHAARTGDGAAGTDVSELLRL